MIFIWVGTARVYAPPEQISRAQYVIFSPKFGWFRLRRARVNRRKASVPSAILAEDQSKKTPKIKAEVSRPSRAKAGQGKICPARADIKIPFYKINVIIQNKNIN